jgi:hypothetical protein
MAYLGALTNNGEIQIDKCSHSGIYLYHTDGFVQNNGTFKVGMLKPISKLLEVDHDGRLFSNNVGDVFQGTGTIEASIFVNAGGTLSSGYSPGIQTFNSSEDFSSSIMAMEVNGTGAAGVAYDQIVVNGTATLGGTLALSVNYAAPDDGTVITLLTTSSLVAVFSAVTDLPENWELKYNYPSTGKISMEYTAPLPVKWVYFQGQLSENGVVLRWKTASEIHNLRFEVERSLDALHWQKIGFVEGNGDTNTQSLYHFLDTTTPSGIHYYRLKQIDLDGRFEFSSIIHVQGKGENNAIKAYPNPTQGMVRIEGVSPDVKVYNILGREVKRETMKGQDLDLSDLPNGLYIISVLNGHQPKSISVMKQN